MSDSHRVALAVLGAGLAFIAAGCGGRDSNASGRTAVETTTPTETSATSSKYGSYPADTSLDESGVVNAYVKALTSRDGTTFCRVVAPWISGRFDISGSDPDASLSHPFRCPELVSGFIGYIEDCCPPEFVGAKVRGFGELDRRGDVVGVPVTVTLVRRESGKGKEAPTYEEPLEDEVWLTRDSGAWRVAKLSLVAGAASIALPDAGEYDTPPNVARERRLFAAEVRAFKRRLAAREASWRNVTSRTSCPGATRYPDGANDVVDYLFPAPRTPTPQLQAADISAVEVGAASGVVCAILETRGAISPGTTFRFAVSSPGFAAGTSGFSQGFEVELRSDGHARVSSGRDLHGRSLSVPGTVGLSGNRLLLEVHPDSFAAGKPYPMSREPSRLLTRFGFVASATVVLSEKRHLHDDLGPAPPTGVRQYQYPAS